MTNPKKHAPAAWCRQTRLQAGRSGDLDRHPGDSRPAGQPPHLPLLHPFPTPHSCWGRDRASEGGLAERSAWSIHSHKQSSVARKRKKKKQKKAIQPLVQAIVGYRGSSGDHNRMVMRCGCRILSLQCACFQLCERAVLRRHVWQGKKEEE